MTTGTTPSFPERYSYTGTQFSGGQAEVFVCSDSLLERKVAIKVIKNISDLPAFYQEIAAIQDISSRHIAEIYDLISNAKDGHPGLVEEYVPGYPLTEFPDANVTLDGYLKALYQIACGIADMHAHNKIHRDIKPANMKFDDENIIKILDFGITCDIDPSVETIAARGTLGFRAPELYSPPITVTPAVDVYAFGATAWYLATKTLPPALLEIPPISKQTAPSFSDLPLKLAQDIVAVLDNTLSVEPSARPLMGTVRDVIKDRLLFGAHKAEFTYG
ncbi:MAG: serine/threonine-protein kinase, partial [Thiohalomonadales bacterium]